MSTEKSELRPVCQVKFAHDAIVGILLNDQLCPPADSLERKILTAQADVLCWCLQHDHNQSFKQNLQNAINFATSKGFTFGREQ